MLKITYETITPRHNGATLGVNEMQTNSKLEKALFLFNVVGVLVLIILAVASI